MIVLVCGVGNEEGGVMLLIRGLPLVLMSELLCKLLANLLLLQ